MPKLLTTASTLDETSGSAPASAHATAISGWSARARRSCSVEKSRPIADAPRRAAAAATIGSGRDVDHPVRGP